MHPLPDRYEFRLQLENAHFRMEAAYRERILRLVRSAEPLTSVAEVHACFGQLNRKLERYPLRYWGLLFDMRRARPQHNLEIEKAFRENREQSYKDFGRYGVLVGSAAGIMQVRRMLQTTPDPRIEVFSDEARALHWVSAKDQAAGRPAE